jgi:endonuclease/exonuclease/phosphatase (EEP) superfamily protein YafD
MLKSTLFLATLILTAGTLIPLARVDSVWVRAFDFPRSQIAILCLLVAGAWLYLSEKDVFFYVAVTLLGGCLFYQLYQIRPYTKVHALQVQNSYAPHPAFCLSLLMANVQMENRSIERFLDIIRQSDPDVLLTVETDQWWADQLASHLTQYPYRLLHPQENYYGIALFSRLHLKEPEVRFLIEDDIPSIHTKVCLRSGDEICLHGLHPRPPLPYPQTDSTGRDAELVVVGRAVKESNEPAIVAGDLNDVAWSHTTRLFQRISGLLDPRIGRGMYNTFHAAYPWFRWPLDHVFHSHHFQLIALKRCAAFGSDHFPVFIALSYEPENRAEQPKPVATAEDHVEANEKIESAEELTRRPVESPNEAPSFAPSSPATAKSTEIIHHLEKGEVA